MAGACGGSGGDTNTGLTSAPQSTLITISDANRTIGVQAGTNVVVNLQACADCGYHWSAASTQLATPLATSQPQSSSGAADSVLETFTWKTAGISPGDYPLNFQYAQSTTTPAQQVFGVTIELQPSPARPR